MRCWRGSVASRSASPSGSGGGDRLGLLGGQAGDGPALAGRPPVVVVEQVERDAPHPADRVVVVAQRAPPHVGPHERLLHGVGRQLAVAA